MLQIKIVSITNQDEAEKAVNAALVEIGDRLQGKGALTFADKVILYYEAGEPGGEETIIAHLRGRIEQETATIASMMVQREYWKGKDIAGLSQSEMDVVLGNITGADKAIADGNEMILASKRVLAEIENKK